LLNSSRPINYFQITNATDRKSARKELPSQIPTCSAFILCFSNLKRKKGKKRGTELEEKQQKEGRDGGA
jgi:hypothetical protein